MGRGGYDDAGRYYLQNGDTKYKRDLPEKRKPVPEQVPVQRFGLDQGLLQV